MSIGHLVVDRDGVLNRERDRPVSSVAEWEWEDGALDAISRIAERGVRLSVVTNQSAIGRGLVSDSAVGAVHRWLAGELVARGVDLVGIFVCPHAPDTGCPCRKPLPGLVLDAMNRSAVPPTATVLIGDDLRDLDAGTAAGVGVALVRTGKGAEVERRGAGRRVVTVYDDIGAAVAALLVADDDPSAMC